MFLQAGDFKIPHLCRNVADSRWGRKLVAN